MPTQIIVDNEYATLQYYDDTCILHHTFHRPIGGDAFRAVLLKGIETLKLKGASKWLSDNRNNNSLSDDDTKWALKTWFPQAKDAGWQYWALVVPDDHDARVSLKEHVDAYYNQGVNVKVFTSVDIAREWLENPEALA